MCVPCPSTDPFGLDLSGLWMRGFSIVELLIVVLLIGTIAGISTPLYFQALESARVAGAIGDIAAMQEEIRLFYMDNGRYPASLAEAGRGAMLDPYGNPYEYLVIAGRGGLGQVRRDRFLVPLNSDFDLYSRGADGETAAALTAEQSHDDIVRANDGGYIGLGSEY